MRGIIYTRVSSDEQVKGTSLRFQEDVCRKYCQEHGIEVVRVFSEEGESAKTADRTELLKALEYCRKNKGTLAAFVVAKVDRFARNTEDHFSVRKLLLEYGLTLHSVTEPIGNSPTEKFVETVLAASAEFDNAVRKQRCTDGMIARLSQGLWPWKPPTGYKCAQHKKRGEKKTVPDKPDERIFPIIQTTLREYATGTIRSQAEMARLLDQKGLYKYRRMRTRPQFVDRLLNDYLKFYAGILVNPWTGEEHQGQHQAMITTDVLLQIQLVRSGRLSTPLGKKHNRFNPQFPLRRTVLCGSCSRQLTGGMSRGKSRLYAYYSCFNAECGMYKKGVRKDVLEKEFFDWLDTIILKATFMAALKASVLSDWEKKGAEYETEAKKTSHELAALEKRRQRIYDLREEGTYTKEVFRERIETVENQIALVRIAAKEAPLDQLDVEAALAYAEQFGRSVKRLWIDVSPELRPRFQRLVLPEGIGYVRNEGFRTPTLGLIFEMNRTSIADLSPVVDPAGNSLNSLVPYLRELLALKEILPLGDESLKAA
jgi:site-specific DNA recombinase